MKRPFLFLCLGVLVLGGGCCFLAWQHTSTPPLDGPAPLPTEPAWSGEETATIDLASRPLDRIPVGTVVGKSPPEGWSHLVLIAIPTLVPEDERDAPRIATHFARMFKLTILANVVAGKAPEKTRFSLERVARGFAMTVSQKERIISGQDTLGADLGVFGRLILKENETILDQDVLQVARTRTMLIFDAKSVMRRNNDHVNMVMRHALLTDPGTGRLFTLVWLLTNEYDPAEDALQLLPEGMWEKRMLSVKRDKFVLGVPSREAFGLRQIPQGTPIAYTPELKEIAGIRIFTEALVPQIEKSLRAAALKASGS